MKEKRIIKTEKTKTFRTDDAPCTTGKRYQGTKSKDCLGHKERLAVHTNRIRANMRKKKCRQQQRHI